MQVLVQTPYKTTENVIYKPLGDFNKNGTSIEQGAATP